MFVVFYMCQSNVVGFFTGTASSFMSGRSLWAQSASIQRSEGPINLTQIVIGGIETGNLIANF